MATKASSRARWKRVERQIAAFLGGVRVPVTGRQRGDAPDIQHEWLSPEVKSYSTVPKWLLEAMTQAEAAAKDGELPVAIVHKKGQKVEDSLVVVRLSDFTAWFVNEEPENC